MKIRGDEHSHNLTAENNSIEEACLKDPSKDKL